MKFVRIIGTPRFFQNQIGNGFLWPVAMCAASLLGLLWLVMRAYG